MLKRGLYEQVINKSLDRELERSDDIVASTGKLDGAEAPQILSHYISELVEKGLRQVSSDDISGQLSLANRIVSAIADVTGDSDFDGMSVAERAEQLLAVAEKKNTLTAVTGEFSPVRPETSLAASSLFTGSIHEPSMMSELKKEIQSADRVDMLVSFVKWSGLRLIIDELSEFTQRGGKLRVITTSYMGATDVKAVKELRKLPNTEIRISYDTKRTRLHAKAYVFWRETGFSTAYVGSSNLSNVAISSGLEWNLKITAHDQPSTLDKTSATFESYWNSHEFAPYSENDVQKLSQALSAEKYSGETADYLFDINPYPYQQEILDRLKAERDIRGHFRNLVVAATGTGKTVISAFDYRRFRSENAGKPCRLLFVAHRKEILEQSIKCFRGVLHDPNFGELFVGEHRPDSLDNLFVSVQTLNSRALTEAVSEDFYDFIIVDEFPGRLMIGRRYNEGLHQAIEAKEGVKIAAESKTLATITFQNYFRMYKKLSGMTGTARTEATEFTEIYGLNIVSVPTNRPVQRKDYPDAIYKTVEGKYRAVIEQVMECHKNGQPVLVGTVSVEKSEILAKMLQRHTRDFNVLNAKNHEREAEIVAQAGKKGAITIATNMAGRGTDIMLGGNAEFMAKAQMRKEHFCENLLNPDTPQDADPAAVELLLTEANGHGETTDANILAARQRFDQLYAQYKPAIDAEADEVRAAGGLFIIGTERHESRRIDNQLRGRAGRQGDPGASRFYLSLEDDLMRLFGGDRVSSLMNTLKIDEDTPIENRMITNTLESAQKKLEGRNFEIRKNVLKYDDVMNQQREIIYGQRRKVLDGEDISTEMHKMLRENIDSSCAQFLSGDVKDEWDFGALRRHYQGWLTTDADFHYTVADFDNLSQQGIADMLYDRGMQILQAKEVRYGAPVMRELERICLLKCVDRQWMDHIDNMDQLRQGIALRGYGQKDPVVEYRIEGFDMFDQMVDSIRESSVKMLLTIELRAAGSAPKREQVAKPTGEGFVPGNGAPGVKGSPKGQPVRVVKIGRNDPCPCGSGLKFKKCTCAQYHPTGNNGGEE